MDVLYLYAEVRVVVLTGKTHLRLQKKTFMFFPQTFSIRKLFNILRASNNASVVIRTLYSPSYQVTAVEFLNGHRFSLSTYPCLRFSDISWVIH